MEEWEETTVCLNCGEPVTTEEYYGCCSRQCYHIEFDEALYDE
ncbi:hypothetical protein [Pontibacter rugosus]|uniref:Phage protein n=1 Tax=Pontibacter rugosus TaxID=1745966 RepID=A0ABW3SJB8_9BACT